MDNMFDGVEPEPIEVGDIFRSIFAACDPDNTNLVHVSRLIEFIKPYLSEDLNALENLRSTLDPEGNNTLVSANTFYDIIGRWSQKLSSASPYNKLDEFDQSSRHLSIAVEERELPYLHSTPRTSLGDKLLKCKDLLNMSNVSDYSLSTSHCDPGGETETAQLEEQKRELEYQLTKVSNELFATKQMLKLSEEQIERLQEDLNRVNRRLQEEQQVIEHLQKNTNNDEDLKEEINKYKRCVTELKKKLTDLEQDNAEFRKLVEDVEKEKLKLEKKLKCLSTEHEACLTALSDVTLAMENMKKLIDEKLQEKEIKLDGFERSFRELQDVVEMLDEKNAALITELAKCKSDKSTNCVHSNLGKYFGPRSPSTSRSFTSPQKLSNINARPKCESHHLLRRAIGRFSSTPQVEQSILDSTLPLHFTLPVLSPLDKEHGSSEEDLISKIHHECTGASGDISNGYTEKNDQQSLWAEMSKVYPKRYSAVLNDTELFEKNEQIVELECKIENMEKEIHELKGKNDKSEKRVEQLQLENVALLDKKIMFKKKVENLEKQTAHEKNLDNIDRVEALCGEIDVLKLVILERDRDLNIKNSELESLRNCLEIEQKERNEDLTGRRVEDLNPTVNGNKELKNKEIIEVLQSQKHSADEKLSSLADQLHASENEQSSKEIQELKTIIEKLLNQTQELHEENFTVKKNFEFMTSKCQSLKKKIVALQEKNSWALAVESENNRSLEAKEKYEKEFMDFKEALEKKLVAEFENKLKQSMDSEEEILNLTQSLNHKNQELKDAENRIEVLSNRNKVIQKEVNECHEIKNNLELKLVELQTTNREERAKISNIGGLYTDINSFVKEKNRVIEELKTINMTLECHLNEAHLDVKQKVETLWEMQTDLAKGVEIRNELWTKMKVLEKDISHKISEINQLEMNSELQKLEHNNLLIIYDLEVEKNGRLVKKVDECQSQIEDFSKRNDFLNKELSETMAKVSDLSEESTKLKALVIEYETTVEKIKEAYKGYKQTHKKKLAEKLEEIQALQAMQQEYTSIVKIDVDSQTILDDIPDIDQLLDELKAKLNHEMDKNKQLTQDLLQLQNNYSENVKELENLRQRLEENEVDMSQRLQDCLEKYNLLTKELNETKEYTDIKESEIIKVTKELKNNLEQYNLLNTELLMTKEALNQKNIISSKMENELLETKAELNKLMQKQQHLETHDLKEAKDAVNEKDIEIAKIEKELSETKRELEFLLQKQEHLENVDLKEAREAINLKDLKLKELTESASNYQLDVLELQESKNKLATENVQLSQNLQNIETTLSDNLNKCLKEIEDLTVELNNKKVEIEDLQSENRSVREELQKIQEENKNLIAKALVSAHGLTSQKELAEELQKEKDILLEELTTIKKAMEDLRKTNPTTNIRLQEEQAKNKHQFDNYLALKRENDKLRFEVKESEALFQNSEVLSRKRQHELSEYQVKCVEMEARITCQKEKLKKVQVDFNLCQKQIETLTVERNKLINELEKVTGKTKTYSKQQVMIEKLKVQVEDLEMKLKQERHSNQQLTAKLAAMEANVVIKANEELSTLSEQILEKRMELEMSEYQVKESKSNVAILEDRLSALELQEKNKISSCICDVATQTVEQSCEAKPINKFTIPSQSENLNLPCFGVDSLAHLKFPCTSISSLSARTESCVELPSIDVKGFADIIEELELTDNTSSQSLKDLEEKVTALTISLVTNTDSITKRIENHTEKYRCQFEKAVSLISDISYRLRDHVCIGTAEPIAPVFVLLEEVKQSLSNMVQDAGQVGALICEHRMRPCWNLFINYSALLRQETEALANISRESTPTQTGSVRRRNNFPQDQSHDVEEKLVQRRSRLGRCSKFCIVALIVGFVAVAAGLLVNLNCRLSASPHQHCPLDILAQRMSNGFPPM